MSVSLSKGGKVNLDKEAQNLGIKLTNVNVGLGWDVNRHGGGSYDLDAWALAVTSQGFKKKNLVYYANRYDSSTYIHHCGDNLTGEGDGDDETITIELEKLPRDYMHILLGVTIYRAKAKRQSFRDIDNAFIRLYDAKSKTEICIYGDTKFKEDFGDSTSLLFGILSRVGDHWEFNAIGRGDKFDSIPKALDIYDEHVLDAIETSATSVPVIAGTVSTTSENGGKKKMAVSLSKGSKVSLAKVASDAGVASLTNIVAGLGWDVQRYDGGQDFDLDAAAFMLGSNGKVRTDTDFIFYNNKVGQGIEHTGDNRTGEGDGDDEQIKIDLNAVPAEIEKISFTVTIDQADTRNQNFGMVEGAYIHIADAVTGTDLVRYDLGEDFSVETAIVVAELYRHNGEWKFNAIGSGFAGGLGALCANFGIDAE